MSGEKQRLLAVVRVRGKVHLRADIQETLRHLKLNKVNHASLFCLKEGGKAMLAKVNDYCTWGEISGETLKKLLSERGMVEGDRKLTDEYLKHNTRFESIQDLAGQLITCKTSITKVEGLKPVFRLNPPVKGHARGGIKKNVKTGGALGYRGEEINKLLEAMI